MIKMPATAVLATALCSGCVSNSSLAPSSAAGSETVMSHAADVLIDGVNYTRGSSREVAGWCWNDRTTDRLASVVQTGIGGYDGIEVALPLDPASTRYVSCTWHTHAWESNVVPGPSRTDLSNSAHPGVSGIAHFVLDRHGIWQYSQGRVIEMCPWNDAGTNVDRTRCRSESERPTNNTYTRVTRYYGRRD